MANEIEKNNGEIIIYQSEDGKIKLSLAEKLVDILTFVADKDQITTEEIVSHFGFNPTTAKRYLRQLTEFGYLEAHGGNKNRSSLPKQQPSFFFYRTSGGRTNNAASAILHFFIFSFLHFSFLSNVSLSLCLFVSLRG